ncbi:hypothetical protein FRC19_008371 [Serendipita sp. 401]|nr:hypothetical protein FRC19_008371 [Serendipita sp. 401]KAG9058748.1 hypothetical protein FS842_003537 [Serendipita sp. 407]
MHASTMFKALVALAAAITPAVADLAVTEPVASTTCTAGQSCTVTWKDNGSSPSLAQLGLCTIALYTGGRQQQTFLQPIAYPTPIDVSTQLTVSFVVDGTVGPNDSNYFIRFSSTNHTQTNSTTAAPSLAFSAKFSLAGMTGTFNQTVLNQIAGSTGSTSASTASSTAGSSSSSRTSSTRSTTATSSSSTPNSGFKADSSAVYVVGAAAFAGLVTLF